jgi:glycosyltransferase involved in cell wall biosynthesis
VTRDGTLGNDQLFLLHLARWLTSSSTADVELLSWREGPLTADLREIVDVRVMAELDEWPPARFFEVLRVRRVAQVLKGLRLRWWLLRRRSADVLYVNGFDAARILGFLRRPSPRVVVHVHDGRELEPPGVSEPDRRMIVARTDLFVAASDEIASRLAGLGVEPPRIHRHDHFLSGAEHLPASTRPPTRRELGFDEGAVVVGGIGTADWWASPDQFVLMAWAVHRRLPDRSLRFLWIAGDDDDRVLWPLRHDLANAGVADFTTIGRGRRPLDYLGALDVLVLSTRVESQDLIALEAAASGVLVVATDNVAGTGRVRDLAVVVPYLDLDALADAVAAAVEDEPGRRTRIEAARAIAHRHHDVSVGAPRLLEVLVTGP